MHLRTRAFPLEARIAHQRLVRICFSDYQREIAIVAEHGRGATQRVVAVGRLNRIPGSEEAEFALLVSDSWQGRGLGTRLLERLIQIGRAEKLKTLRGTVLQDNFAMLRLCRQFGFQTHPDADAGILTVHLQL